MSNEPLSLEPDSVVAGDTLKFYSSISETDYPDGTWTVAYTIVGVGGKITATVTESDGKWLVTFSATATAGLAAGTYAMVGTATSGAERCTLFDQSLIVTLDVAAASAGDDTRSDARIAYESVTAVIQGRATKDQESYTINGRSLSRTSIEDLYVLRDRLKAEVDREERAERVKRGLSHEGKILVRMP